MSTDDRFPYWVFGSQQDSGAVAQDQGAPPNLDPVTAAHHVPAGPRGVVYAIAPSRTADRDLWVGTDDGLVWRSRDEGEHWQDVTPAALTPWSKVGIIETSHFDADTAYLAIDRHRLDDFHPYVYRTHDGGEHWQLASAGIPDDRAVNVVREDPVRRGLLYAGTEKGIHVSFDDGDHWQSLQLGLPVTSVRDIDVHGDDLVIATHGRGFWILDDVTPLRQLDDAVGRAPSWLFRPAAAVRFRPAGFTGTPLPKDEPAVQQPRQDEVPDHTRAGYLQGSLGMKGHIHILPPRSQPTKRTNAKVSPQAELAINDGNGEEADCQQEAAGGNPKADRQELSHCCAT